MGSATREGFVRAICEEPHDDAHRLIFADWLEDHGEPERAEFIRVQMRLDELKPGPEEHRKAANMLRRHQKGAAVPLKANTPAVLLVRNALLLGEKACLRCDWHMPLDHGGWRWEYDRGFVSLVRCTCEHWKIDGPRIVNVQPITEVRLTDCYWRIREFGRGDDHFTFGIGDVPGWLYQAMIPKEAEGRHWSYIDLGSGSTADEADAFAGRCAINWAREQAGLPPLS